MPKISVIMPVYNTNEKYFREAIESILNQTFSDLELIIVDDCSQEYIRDIVLSYTDNRIKYYRLDKNQGAANARNFAISKANGKYIAFLDSDDESILNRLEIQYNFLEQNSEIGCLGAKVEVIDSVNKNQTYKFPDPTKHKDIEEYLILKGCVFCQSTVMLRKDILDKNNITYKTKYVPAEDYAFWLDMVGYTKFAVLDDVLLKYRYYADNISNRKKDIQLQKSTDAQLSAIEKYCNIKFKDKDILRKFFCSNGLEPNEIKDLHIFVREITDAFKSKGFSENEVFLIFRRKFKKIYYHTRSLSGQRQLLSSPLNGLFNIPISLRIFCFITRGIF